jgi:hypothetical protein
VSDRYDGKPFLRYVDAWVLDAIGHLDEPTRAYCVAMEPTLRQSLGLSGSWQAMVAKQMKFAPELAGRVRRIWEEGKAKFAAGNGHAPDPVQFAFHFVDRNFGRA